MDLFPLKVYPLLVLLSSSLRKWEEWGRVGEVVGVRKEKKRKEKYPGPVFMSLVGVVAPCSKCSIITQTNTFQSFECIFPVSHTHIHTHTQLYTIVVVFVIVCPFVSHRATLYSC